jgi:hypothetical protein
MEYKINIIVKATILAVVSFSLAWIIAIIRYCNG